ncbi:hypothetical protein GCM10010449_53930 [Streptomyces rectiviolaceus]|uniref:Uncharacterized protein n=1 Tax=Streptomyces rectiviolaceus TaxID=332591 RepID=A0ABP6MV25_9ACTN
MAARPAAARARLRGAGVSPPWPPGRCALRVTLACGLLMDMVYSPSIPLNAVILNVEINMNPGSANVKYLNVEIYLAPGPCREECGNGC